jgi:hypothetical protein
VHVESINQLLGEQTRKQNKKIKTSKSSRTKENLIKTKSDRGISV